MEELKELLTEVDCKQILSSYLNVENVKLISYSIRPLSGDIEGFLGEHRRVKIEYKLDDQPGSMQLFMKSLNPASQISFETAMSIGAYDREECFYKNLVNEFLEYNIDLSFAPRGYFCKPHLIVLEDISLRGFKMVPKRDMFDLAHIKKALECLAKFHASSLIYEEIRSKEMKREYRLLESYGEKLNEVSFFGDNGVAEWFKASMKGIYCIIDLLPEDDIPHDLFKKKLQEILDDLLRMLKPSTIHRNAMRHGDLWTNNIMFRYEEGLPVEAKVLDFQLLNFAPPSTDVIEMIVVDTRKHLRDAHFDEMLDHYYYHLGKCLEEHDLDVNQLVPKDDFLGLIKEYQICVRLLGIADRSLTFMKNECLEDAMKDDESARKFFFDDRNKYMVDSFNDPDFKEIITEDLLELKEFIFKK